MIDIICAAVAAAATIIVAVIGNSVKKQNARTEEREREIENRAKLRQKESMLSLKMMDATLQLSVVSSNALTGGHNNGNVERAREAAEDAAAEYENFLRETTIFEVTH